MHDFYKTIGVLAPLRQFFFKKIVANEQIFLSISQSADPLSYQYPNKMRFEVF